MPKTSVVKYIYLVYPRILEQMRARIILRLDVYGKHLCKFLKRTYAYRFEVWEHVECEHSSSNNGTRNCQTTGVLARSSATRVCASLGGGSEGEDNPASKKAFADILEKGNTEVRRQLAVVLVFAEEQGCGRDGTGSLSLAQSWVLGAGGIVRSILFSLSTGCVGRCVAAVYMLRCKVGASSFVGVRSQQTRGEGLGCARMYMREKVSPGC